MCSLKLWMAGIFLAVLFYLHVEITISYNKVISFYPLVQILLKDFKCSYQKACRWHNRLTQNSPLKALTPSPRTQAALRLYFFQKLIFNLQFLIKLSVTIFYFNRFLTQRKCLCFLRLKYHKSIVFFYENLFQHWVKWIFEKWDLFWDSTNVTVPKAGLLCRLILNLFSMFWSFTTFSMILNITRHCSK